MMVVGKKTRKVNVANKKPFSGNAAWPPLALRRSLALHLSPATMSKQFQFKLVLLGVSYFEALHPTRLTNLLY